MKFSTLLLSVVLLFATFTTNAAPITGLFDDFNTGDFLIEDSVLDGSGESITTTGTGILSGSRTATVMLTDRDFGAGDVRVEVAGGVFSYSADSGASGTASLLWDFGTGIDLESMWEGFNIKVIQSDAGFKYDIVTEYIDDISLTEETNVASFISTGFASPGIQSFFFDDTIFGDTNFAEIVGIKFVIDPFGEFANLDLTIDMIETVNTVDVPETSALFGLGLLALAAAKRKSNKER